MTIWQVLAIIIGIAVFVILSVIIRFALYRKKEKSILKQYGFRKKDL